MPAFANADRSRGPTMQDRLDRVIVRLLAGAFPADASVLLVGTPRLSQYHPGSPLARGAAVQRGSGAKPRRRPPTETSHVPRSAPNTHHPASDAPPPRP